jgi:arylsulfatase A-like enzyme
LLGILTSKHYLENALVVLTADHGESLGEHDLYSHTNSVREELLHIPLLFIRYKGGTPQDSKPLENFVSQVDIAPTILHELEIPVPESWNGVPIQLGKTSEITFFQMLPYWGLYDHRDSSHLWKYWFDSRNGEEFVFDLLQDPHENANLAAATPKALKSWWRERLNSIYLNAH